MYKCGMYIQYCELKNNTAIGAVAQYNSGEHLNPFGEKREKEGVSELTGIFFSIILLYLFAYACSHRYTTNAKVCLRISVQ